MNVLIFRNSFPPEHVGLSRSIGAAAAHFRRLGHKVLIAVPQSEVETPDERGTLHVPLFQKLHGGDLAAAAGLPAECREQLQEFSPQIVHSHHAFLLGAAALDVAREFSIPLLYTPHAIYQHDATYVPHDAPALRRLSRELDTAYCNLADGVLAHSAGHAARLRQRGVVAPIHVVPAGLAIECPGNGDRAKVRHEHGIPPEAWVVGCGGPLPGDALFLGKAIGEFLSRNRQAHVLVVGEASSWKTLQELWKSPDMAGRAHFAAAPATDGLADMLAAMDVVAAAPRVEVPPLFVLNALAAGLPVVATDAPGLSDWVRNGEHGRVLPHRSRRSFVAALEDVAANPDRQTLRENARRTAAGCSAEACGPRALEVYAQLAEAGPQASGDSTRWDAVREQIEVEWRFWSQRQHSAEGADADRLYPSRVPVLRHFVSLWRRCRRWLSRREWSVKLLDLPVSVGTTDEPGLVLLQIDGLSRVELERAIERGRMPFLLHLRRRELYSTHTMYSGQPATTPAVLGELFYGVEQAVPAFGFRDHRTGEIVEMFHPGIASRVQQELSQEGEGLLAGGVAYCDIYSGGADDSSFCPATTGWRNLEDAAMWRRVLLFGLNFMSLFRIAALCVIELCVSIGDFFRGIIKGHEFWRELLYIPRRVIVNVALREFLAISVEADVTRGVRAVHANFLGYDENAHRRGPDALFAHYALWGIDRAIRRIWDAAHGSHRRSYHVWIMADHGQQRTIPYTHENGRHVGDVVAEFYRNLRPGEAPVHDDDAGRREKELRSEPQRSRWLRSGRHETASAQKLPDRSAERLEPTTVGVGPLGYIYWPEQLAAEEIERLAPRLVREAHIPLVMACSGDEVFAWNASGRYRMPEQAAEVLAADHPFFQSAAEDFTRLCSHPDAGDFVISGWRSDRLPISFVPENGAHGGPGPLETQGFVMVSPDAPSPAELEAPFRPKSLRSMALSVLERQPLPGRQPLRSRTFVRLATYNVHSCIGLDGRLSPSRVARVIAAAEPDIVALQELDVRRGRTRFVDQVEQIARILEMEAHFHPALHVEDEQYGNAVLSRFPLELVKAAQLPHLLVQTEPRGAIWVQADLGDARLQIINTHLGLAAIERGAQIDELLGDEWLEPAGARGPVVMCGDLNLGPGSHGYRKIAGRLLDAQKLLEKHRPRATWFSRLPVRRIDHVFVDDGIRVTRIDTPRTRLSRLASDHLPLIVDLEIAPHAPSASCRETADVLEFSR